MSFATTIYPYRRPDRVYCAGPLFNAAERREMEDLAASLQAAGFETFVPHADGMEFAQVRPYLIDLGYDGAEVGRWLHEAVFALDVYQVAVGCGALLFNLNGRVPDEGGVAELTIAWMLGKPAVVYKEDARSMIAGRDNPLVVGQVGFQTAATPEGAVALLADQIATAAPDVDAAAPAPPPLARAISQGEQLWSALADLGATRDNEILAPLLLELFADGVGAE